MFEDEEIEQPEDIEKNKDEIEIESGYLEAKDSENTNTRPRRSNAGKRVERLEINFCGGKYDTQFNTNTGEKINIYA